MDAAVLCHVTALTSAPTPQSMLQQLNLAPLSLDERVMTGSGQVWMGGSHEVSCPETTPARNVECMGLLSLRG
jgi:hypothetical protein